MDALPNPVYEARVSPALVQHRWAREAKINASAAPEQDRRDLQADQPTSQSDVGSQSIFETVVLRQDGNRPIKIRAALVFEASSSFAAPNSPDMTTDRSVRLYVSRDGILAAHVQLQPGETCPLRPVWRVTEVTSSADLASLNDEVAMAFEALATKDRANQVKNLSDIVRAAPPLTFRLPGMRASQIE